MFYSKLEMSILNARKLHSGTHEMSIVTHVWSQLMTLKKYAGFRDRKLTLVVSFKQTKNVKFTKLLNVIKTKGVLWLHCPLWKLDMMNLIFCDILQFTFKSVKNHKKYKLYMKCNNLITWSLVKLCTRCKKSYWQVDHN